MNPILALPRPKDSDHALRADVSKVLQDSSYTVLRTLDCKVRDGIVELCGDVPSFYCKQLAQATVLSLKHVRGINNRLRVL